MAEPKTTDPDAAVEQIAVALGEVAAGLRKRAAVAPDHAKAVLEAGAMMALDPGLSAGIAARLRAGKGITLAVWDAAEEFADMFASLGGYMAERVADLRDVRDRAIARLRGLPEPGVPTLVVPSILVARDLAPAETAMLTPDTCRGIVTTEGGPTSHTAILAAQLGIPAVVQAVGLAVADGTVLAVDGSSGVVTINPTMAEQDQLAQRQARRQAATGDDSAPGRTADGHPVPLLANIGTIADAESAATTAVEGVGLFRTEFLFLDRDDAPTLEEQTATYTRVLQAFPGQRVVVRTLDAGADKPLKFANQDKEDNPALGLRGLRLSMLREHLLDTQLTALAAVGQATQADLQVMAPMVSTKADGDWFAAKAASFGLSKAGAMIEIPAAALRCGNVLTNLHFASLGTNDLQQYAMGADRLQGGLARYLSPWEPALLDLIAIACRQAGQAGKPIGVCGEAAADPALALVLVGLGVTSLSMAPSRVPAVRAALVRHSLAQCQELAEAARSFGVAEEAKRAVLDQADAIVKDLV
jgi:phosphotransferase system enzyme I (PtsI)